MRLFPFLDVARATFLLGYILESYLSKGLPSNCLPVMAKVITVLSMLLEVPSDHDPVFHVSFRSIQSGLCRDFSKRIIYWGYLKHVL